MLVIFTVTEKVKGIVHHQSGKGIEEMNIKRGKGKRD